MGKHANHAPVFAMRGPNDPKPPPEPAGPGTPEGDGDPNGTGGL